MPAPKQLKPTIYFRGGYWRVREPMPRPLQPARGEALELGACLHRLAELAGVRGHLPRASYSFGQTLTWRIFMLFRSTKTYGHERGLSCAFRQHRADSHCHLLHGYALSFRFVFEADQLDSNRWVLDFGALKPLKEQLDQWFDHKVAVAKDDPLHAFFEELHHRGAIEIVQMDYVGCEAFARHAWNL